MSKKLALLLRENLALRGMSPEAIEQNLPGLLEQVTAPPSKPGVTRAGNEGRPRDDSQDTKKKPQTGHGPTPQPNLEIQSEFFDLDFGLCHGSRVG